MEKINCIIVEDEPLASEILKGYIAQVPLLHLVAICEDAIYALDILQREKIDLIFLDINLPKLKGFDFIKTLKNPPAIIITTAYHEYALLGYEFNVVDYLMKPIAFPRFLEAVNKVRRPKEATANRPIRENKRECIFLNADKKKVKIYLDEILYIESVREYVKIVTPDKTLQTKFQLSQMEELLPKDSFIRIHRSFIAAKDKIDAFTATDVEIGNKQIPIGRSYKELVRSILER